MVGIKRIINDKTETARKKNDKTIQPLCKRTASISSCTLAFFVDSEASTRDTYTVKLHAPNGLGLSWFVSYEGIVTVEGLHYLSDNSASPAQLCDLIKVGDQLIGFNETNLEILSFYDLTNIMKDVDRHAKDIVVLTFRYGDVAPILPAPAAVAQENNASTATTSNELLVSRRESRLHDPSDSFLAIFGEQDGTSTSAVTMDGMLHSLGDWRPLVYALSDISYSSSRTQPLLETSKTSEVALIHFDLCSRHLYAAAARPTTFAASPPPPQLLQVLAEEIFEWRPFQLSYAYAGFYAAHLREKRIVSGTALALSSPVGSISPLIVTPRDTARYCFTEHLQWDPALHSFVPEQVPTLEAVAAADEQMKSAVRVAWQQLLMSTLQHEQHSAGTAGAGSAGCGGHKRNGSTGFTSTEGVGEIKPIESMGAVLELEGGVRCYVSRPPVCKQDRGGSRNSTSLSSSSASPTATVVAYTSCSQRAHQFTHSESPRRLSYYKKSAEHWISKDHSAVKRLLSCHSDEALQLLEAAVQEVIISLTDSSTKENPYDNARHCDTGLEISLPNFLLTYQVLYVAEHLQMCVLDSEAFISTLQTWATTFNPKGIMGALQWQQQSMIATSNNSKSSSSTGEWYKKKPFLVYFSNDRKTARDLRVYLEVVADLLTLLVLARTVPGGLTRTEEEVTIDHSGNNSGSKHRGAQQQALPWLPSTFSLKHLPFQLETMHTHHHTCIAASHSVAPFEDAVTASYVRKFGALLHLDALVSACCMTRREETLQAVLGVARVTPQMTEASSQLRQFVQRSQTAVVGAVQLLERVVPQYFVPLSQAQNSSNNGSGHGQGGRHSHSTSGGHGNSSGAPVSVTAVAVPLLCLVLDNLRFVFEHHAALALDLAGVMFPLVRPWCVRAVIFGSDSGGGGGGDGASDTSITEVLIDGEKAADKSPAPRDAAKQGERVTPPLVQAVSTYYAYITRLMRSQAATCAGDSDLVLEWLQLALQLDAEHADGADGAAAFAGGNHFSSPQGKRKSSYLVTVRTVLHHPEQYALVAFDAAVLCAAYAYSEGVVLLCERMLEDCNAAVAGGNGRVRHGGRGGRAMGREQHEEVTRLLEETAGRLVAELVLQVHAAVLVANDEDRDDAVAEKPAATTGRGVHATPPNKETNAVTGAREKESYAAAALVAATAAAVATHVGALLGDCVFLLCTLYSCEASLPTAVSKGKTPAPAVQLISARLARTLDLLLEETLEAIVPESEALRRSVGGQVANSVCDALLTALDVRQSLEVVRQAPYLRGLL